MAMRARLVRSPAWRPRRAVPASVAFALAAAFGLVGCGTSGSSSGELDPTGTFATGPASAPTSPGAAPSAVPTAQLYKTVLDRYREYQKVYKQAYDENDPSKLASVAVDPLLSQVTDDIKATKAEGEIWRFTNTHNPRIYAKSSDSTKLYVIDCIRTLAGYRYSATTGERLGGGPGDAYLYRTTVQWASGTWKVAASVRDRAC
ncbi:hypothetical protein BJF79_34310 [Actinomadura sp. CNU-125]|uniref:hypothetical protein n=1 Tax=Actinomadura sp. CNU-125 TaxID=1904961 RepID=UPI0009606EC0|nr:hypothetical protein [Actinomadura sp. CNU-125]OLT33646.1 hypothetical protein BJF79_34310 [Actinomadura sp. CNU-125]